MTAPRASRLALAVRGALLSAALAAPLLGAPAFAEEATSAASRSYAIPAGPLDEVLNRFAREAGINLSATRSRPVACDPRA